MPYVLATSTELNEGELGGAIRVPDVPWLAENGYLTINGEQIPAGETVCNYFTYGYNSFLPLDSKHELSAEQIAQIPKKITYHFKKSGPPDICGMDGSELLFSQRVKDKLEELEPGAHNYFPVIVEHPKTGEQVEGYYLAYVWQRPNIIDFSKSLMATPEIGFGLEFAKRAGYMPRSLMLKGVKGWTEQYRYLINFKESGYEGHHLWRGTVGPENIPEQYHGHNGRRTYHDNLAFKIFVSDEFGKWMNAEKISGTKPIPILEETIEWFVEQQEKEVFR